MLYGTKLDIAHKDTKIGWRSRRRGRYEKYL